jgi:hypothetical protein
MELMPGATLKDLLDQEGPLPSDRAVTKILDVIDGLQEAHRLGVIHRDVKPSNCFVDADGRVKIGDFGLSKSLMRDAHLTRTGAFLGTPLFSSPEQVRGERVDEQSDVHAVAATLYCLLTGQAPFQCGDTTATLARIVADPPPPMHELRPELPRALDRAVLRGLERDRARRWRNLEEFRQALLPFVPGQLPLGQLGIRFGAVVADYIVLFLLTLLVSFGLYLGNQWDIQHPPQGTALFIQFFLSLVIMVLCWAVPEGLWGCSLGKWLSRLRVWKADDNAPPGLPRTLLRTVIFGGLLNLGTLCVVFAGPAVYDYANLDSEQVLQQTGRNMVVSMARLAGMVLGSLVLLSSMRARNGYRGVHEFASGTRVVLLPPLRERWSVPSRVLHQHLQKPAGLPERIGSYAIAGVLCSSGESKILLGEDELLGRQVFIWLQNANAPVLSASRRALNRPTRLRWLGSGTQAEVRWDSFQARAGSPLADLIPDGQRLSWTKTRHLLESLTEELLAACEEQTLPQTLEPEQVWVQTNGQVIVLDFPVCKMTAESVAIHAAAKTATGFDPEDDAVPEVELADDEPEVRAMSLLRRIIVLALEGRPRLPEERRLPLRVPLPLSARETLQNFLRSGTKQSLKGLADALKKGHTRPTEVSRGRRAAHVGVMAALLLLPLCGCLVPIPTLPGFMIMSSVSAQVADRKLTLEDFETEAQRDYKLTEASPDPAVREKGHLQWQEDRKIAGKMREQVEAAERQKQERMPGLGWYWRTLLEQFELQQAPQLRTLHEQRRQGGGASPRQKVRWLVPQSGPPIQFTYTLGLGPYLVTLVLIVFWPVCWVLWALLFRGGLSYRWLGLTLVRCDGRRASRLQYGLRALVVWLPVTTLLALTHYLSFACFSNWLDWQQYAWMLWLATLSWWLAILLLLIFALSALRSPNRALHDRLARIYLVPR